MAAKLAFLASRFALSTTISVSTKRVHLSCFRKCLEGRLEKEDDEGNNVVDREAGGGGGGGCLTIGRVPPGSEGGGVKPSFDVGGGNGIDVEGKAEQEGEGGGGSGGGKGIEGAVSQLLDKCLPFPSLADNDDDDDGRGISETLSPELNS